MANEDQNKSNDSTKLTEVNTGLAAPQNANTAYDTGKENPNQDSIAMVGNEAVLGELYEPKPGSFRSIIDDEDEVQPTRTFFNRAYRRFRVNKKVGDYGQDRGHFEFRDGYLRLTEDEAEEFLSIVKAKDFPRSESVHIVEVNEVARAASERSVLDEVPGGQGIVRGPMSAGDILTGKDQERLSALNQVKPGANGGALNPTPTPARPAFNPTIFRR